MQSIRYDYEEYPKTLAPDDFWGQVRRTINGERPPEDQIQMIVAAIREGLALEPGDQVVDLACGNGALTDRYAAGCASVRGVDLSRYLISVAKANFEHPPHASFMVGDAGDYVRTEPEPARFTKAVCYGSFQLFSVETAALVLETLRRRFTGLRRVYLGNCPDRKRANVFYPEGKDYRADLDDPTSPIGIWRSQEQMRELAERTGWHARFHQMPSAFHWGHYRYDVILHPAGQGALE